MLQLDLIDNEMTNTVTLCSRDVVSSEVSNFRQFSGNNASVYGYNLSIVFVDFVFPMPISDLASKATSEWGWGAGGGGGSGDREKTEGVGKEGT